MTPPPPLPETGRGEGRGCPFPFSASGRGQGVGFVVPLQFRLDYQVSFRESTLNKRKKVAWRKHRIRRKKLEQKRQIGSLARRK